MIEINLVPDVKQELIQAQRVRASVISIAVITGIAAIGVVVVLALYVVGVQAGRGYFSDQSIKSESQKLSNVEDISRILTIQNQLDTLTMLHDDKHLSSRVFNVLSVVTPQDQNRVATTKLSVDTTNKVVTIEGQADNNYIALDVFKKTILATKLEFTKDGAAKTIPLTAKVDQGEQSFGEDNTGKKVLRFTISFIYPDELFERDALNVKVVGPARANATDSFVGVPTSIFTTRAADVGEEE